MFLKSDLQLNKKSIKDNTIKYSSEKRYINYMIQLDIFYAQYIYIQVINVQYIKLVYNR